MNVSSSLALKSRMRSTAFFRQKCDIRLTHLRMPGKINFPKLRLVLACAAVLASYLLFFLLFPPSPSPWLRLLPANEAFFDTAGQLMSGDWRKFLFPQVYKSGEVLWLTTSSIPIYLVAKYFAHSTQILFFPVYFR